MRKILIPILLALSTNAWADDVTAAIDFEKLRSFK